MESTITALRRVPGRARPGGDEAAAPSSRVEVEVDGAAWVVLEEVDVLRLGLRAGMALDDELHGRALEASRAAAAGRRAGRLLSRRPLATADLEARLVPVAGADAARTVVGQLERLGVLDDRALADALAVERLRRGFGPEAIRAMLRQRAVPEAVVREAIDALSRDEVVAAAHRAVDGRTGAAGWRRLAGRGFDEDVAEAVLGSPPDSRWDEDVGEDGL